MYFANVDFDGYCIGISSCVDGNLRNNPYCVGIDCYDMSFVGRKYDFENKMWSDEWKNRTYDFENPFETLGQQQSDIELNLFDAQYERALIAQQITDVELAILEGGI
ncbi:hypothetical protein B5E58_01285 [Tyzzerella sp. An114]|mgnify:CR=1 FL=1|uniref:hypothetical protein n=1 Tax=Tyzzerella sp. An114 TaxID=1965545 RepID=UPI000B451FBE|nr:hypothetical protein [Tyzzerella sp. An114]OUQ60532.1 hypothetical protein B5E58_01285 [Tyzzerella sp. An114]HIT72892.1 hypothetical protein [Candidatus Fimicola cottocaccae]